METAWVIQNRERVEEFQKRHRVGVLTLLFTDLVGSTKLKQELGDTQAVMLVQQHHAALRGLLKEFPEGEEIETAGDSFFVVFTKPSDAVRFALRFQASIREWNRGLPQPVLDRVGIHVGEVFIQEHTDGGKAKDLFGIQIDTAARIMGLAQGGQILMSRFAFDNARQALKGLELQPLRPVSWLNHGSYAMKGVDDPVEICEVGETGEAPLKAPADSEKARRTVAEGEPVLGWRPALDQDVPGTEWVLERKLGEGGFGEVWLGRHKKLKDRRVFKFCFRADRARSLKREQTLFRVLKEKVGEHPNIVAVRDVYLDAPPYYLVTDYVEGADLKTWCEQQGGADKVPLAVKLEIIAQVADALQAAHEAGVIHRDVKPSNILVHGGAGPGAVRVKLTDFGIGQVVSAEALTGMTKLGFTLTMMSPGSAQTGTQVYMAPELLTGQTATKQSDLYSLGVVLYQLLAGDFNRPLTMDWGRRVEEPLLREDLDHCFAGEPQERFSGAADLAGSLRGLEVRRQQRVRTEAEQKARERAAYRRGQMRTAAVAAAIVAIVGILAVYALHQARLAKDAEHRSREAQREAQRLLEKEFADSYVANVQMAGAYLEQGDMRRVRERLQACAAQFRSNWEWRWLNANSDVSLTVLEGHAGYVRSAAFSPDGKQIVTASGDNTARIWDASTWRMLVELKGHSSILRSAVFSPDGKRVVTASWDKSARIWDAKTGGMLVELKGHADRVESAIFSPDGKRVVTASADRTARIWDVSTGVTVTELMGHAGRVRSTAFSPDGKRVVTASEDNTARIWDANTEAKVVELKRHAGFETSAAFSPDGARLVTASSVGIGRIWDAITGNIVAELTGHAAWMQSAVFSPDGKRVVTASWDKSARIWDAKTGGMLVELKGHADRVESAIFSLDGKRVVTASADRTARIWDASTGVTVTKLMGHAGIMGLPPSVRTGSGC